MASQLRGRFSGCGPGVGRTGNWVLALSMLGLSVGATANAVNWKLRRFDTAEASLSLL